VIQDHSKYVFCFHIFICLAAPARKNHFWSRFYYFRSESTLFAKEFCIYIHVISKIYYIATCFRKKQ
jgi:hypothetical protein